MISTLRIAALIALIVALHAEPQEDQLAQVPGYPLDFTNRVFAGYLKTQSDLRKLHYTFMQSNKGVNNSAPVLLWLNGGPGCTSKIGLVMEIAPYCLNEAQQYNSGDPLSANPYGWSNITNLLFIDSPAGTGYSINKDPNFVHDDSTTSKDLFFAVKEFFNSKFPQYANNTFFLAGQSYAGKYVPDLAMRILSDPSNKINLKGILLGNPVLNLLDLQQNRVQWMISHNLIDPQLLSYWQKSCKVDVDSAGCQYFYQRYEDLIYRIDQYNIYGQCYGRSGSRQSAIVADLAIKMSPFKDHSKLSSPRLHLNSDQWCSYDAGIEQYLNINAKSFNSQNTNINVCNMTIYNLYKVDPKGSMSSILSILKKGIKVFLYTGDWDSVVPFTDTFKNLERMSLKLQGSQLPWLIGTTDKQHAGFYRIYSYNLTVYQVKGAGHQVPLYQRERAFRMFQKFVYA